MHPPDASKICEGFQRSQVRIELRCLDNCAHALQGLLRVSDDIDTLKKRSAAGGSDQVRHYLDRCGLACTVRSQESDRLALGHLQVETVNCLDRPERLGQLLELYHHPKCPLLRLRRLDGL